MATAPNVPNFAQFNFVIGDTTQVVTKQNGLNAALSQFGNSLETMTQSINTDLQTMEGQKTATQQAAQAASEDAEQIAFDKQAVADDRTHVDQQKQTIDTTAGQVTQNAQQVATDKQAVADDRLAAQQSAGTASDAAIASVQAKNDAQALYGDLQAVENAKAASQQAAQNAGEERALAVTAREGAETAQGAAETAASESQQTAEAAVQAHAEEEDPHTQYEFRVMHNISATRSPNANDDSTAGYAARSTWFDTSLNPPEAYRCISATEGAAQWVKTSLTLDELGSAALANTEDFETAGAAGNAIQAHIQEEDPHTQYEQKTALKAAAYREVVGGSGDLMAEGAFGLGAQIPVTQVPVEQVSRIGLYSVDNSDPLNPFGMNCQLVFTKHSNSFGTGLFISHSATNPEIAIRTYRVGIWQEVSFRCYSQTNILGTVSQSGGVPTGAIIQQDSNDFGEFTILADGRFFAHRLIETLTLDDTSAEYDLPVSNPILGTVTHSLSGRVSASSRARRQTVRDHIISGAVNWHVSFKKSETYNAADMQLALFASGMCEI